MKFKHTEFGVSNDKCKIPKIRFWLFFEVNTKLNKIKPTSY